MNKVKFTLAAAVLCTTVCSVSSAQNRAGSNNVLQQVIENQIRGEIRNAVGLPRQNNLRLGNQRNGQFNLNNGIRFSNNGRNVNTANFNRLNGRYRNDPIVSEIVRRFPEASRILSSRTTQNNGGFYRNNNQYYYYPNQYRSSQGVRTISGTNVPYNSNVASGSDHVANAQPIPVKFGGFKYIDELSQVLPSVVNDLCLDMHYNYRGAANFDSAYRDAYEMLRVSKLVRDAQQANDRDGIRQHLTVADQLLHQVERKTQGWVRQHNRQIGEMGLLTKLEITSDMTHHMMYDVGLSLQTDGTPHSVNSDRTGDTEIAPPPSN